MDESKPARQDSGESEQKDSLWKSPLLHKFEVSVGIRLQVTETESEINNKAENLTTGSIDAPLVQSLNSSAV